jgi:N,N'-diacetyllegionaminate synthase
MLEYPRKKNNNIIIIAEAGVNHNGSLGLAIQLINVAANAGADYVKFQTFVTEENITKKAKKASYQLKTAKQNESQFEMVKKLEISQNDHRVLLKHCKKSGIKFLSTAFDITSINFLMKLKVDFIKIPSGEITNLPYLQYVGNLSKHIVLSTGMSTLNEVSKALDTLINAGTPKEHITVLHCNTEYPTPMEDVNLNAMLTINKTLDVKVGYSDHTLGLEIPIAAAALGATVIEKHFTLDRNMEGPDHRASLEPTELIAMVNAIRNIEKALGDGVKRPSTSELNNIGIARKSIVAKQSIKKGEKFSTNNLTIKRPGTGVSPLKWDSYLGKESDKNYEPDDLIS